MTPLVEANGQSLVTQLLKRGGSVSHPFYEVVHIIGIVMLFSALGGTTVRALLPMVAEAPGPRRMLGVVHGIGAFLVLLGGFGMLARLGIMQGGGFPGWLWVKIVIWGALAAAPFFVRRRPALARSLLWSLPVLGGIAAYAVIYKPF
jgi:hypothetical protein